MRLPLSCTLLAVAAFAAAEEQTPIIDTVIVTADRDTERLGDTSASVDVVQRSTIHDRGGALDDTDWLRGLPGVDVLGTGGGIDGGITQLRLRGSSHVSDTQVLVDGVPLYDVTTTETNPILPLAPVPGLSRIEVVRGPQSSLYGSRAVGGVVDFITARPTADARGDATLEYGSFDTMRADASVTGPLGSARADDGRPRLGFALGADGLESRGFSAQTTRADGDPRGFEDDGLRRLAADGRVDYAFGERGDAYLSGMASQVRQEFDGFAAPDEDDVNRNQLERIGGGVSVGLPHDADVGVDYAHTRTLRRSFMPFGDFQFRGDDDFVGGKAGVGVLPHLRLGVGGDVDHQRSVTDAVGHEAQWLAGAYAKATFSDGPYEADAVARHDRTSRESSEDTYRLGAAWSPLERAVRAHAAIGTAFRAPSLDERFGFYPSPFGNFTGNPDLEPQTSRSWEAGLDWRPTPTATLGSTYFDTRYRRRIRSVFDASFNGTLVNETSDSRVRGVESEAIWDDHALPVAVRASHTWQESQDENGARFTYLPMHKASLDVTLRAWRAWETTGVDAVGWRPAQDGTRLPGYATLHAAIGYAVSRDVELYLRGENLLDKHHAEDSYDDGTGNRFAYTSMPFAVFGGVNATF